MIRVLVVCLGNICRSPIGEGLLRSQGQNRGLDLFVDSAGTMGWHAGKAPDHRSQGVMRAHGLDISSQQSRPMELDDFQKFDVILCMDQQNLTDVLKMAKGPAHVQLFVAGKDVPDPYYGGDAGFEAVYSMLDSAASNWINNWMTNSNS
tara:strand:- start:1012 stop:1458 length:447 start_codon:yes stop_codon:yes gene_type:complete